MKRTCWPPARVYEPAIPDPAVPVALRRVGDEEHRIVKIFYSPAELTGLLAGEGWSADIRRTDDRFFTGTARYLTPGRR